MSIGMILHCKECNKYVYIGTANTEMVEEPNIVGQFLWDHKGHTLTPYSEGTITFQLQVLEGDGAGEYVGR